MILFVLFFFAKELISNVDSITKISQSAGVFGPIVLIVLITLGILFTPIPSVVLIITAGYLYGAWMGAIYSYIAHMFAATGTFSLVKTFNIKTKNKRYKKYQNLVEKNRKILYLLYTIPIIPISIISIISASSKIKWRQFLKITLLSFIPAVLLFSFFGERISNKNLLEIGIWTTVILIGLLIILEIMRKRMKKSSQ